jgi:hypothetical protein
MRPGESGILNRNVALDIFKLTAAFMIVGLHSKFLVDVSLIGHYLTVNGIFRIAVPFFLLINGFYFYPVLVKDKSAYWVKRILYIYFFWMLFYSYYWFRPSEISFIEIAQIAHTLIFGYYHLWYLSGLLGSAVLVILFKNHPPRLMIPIILIIYVAGVIIYYTKHYHMVENLSIIGFFTNKWFPGFFFSAFPFFYIGFVINKLNIHERVSLKYSAGLSLIAFALLISESYFNYIESSRYGVFVNFTSLLMVCPALFLLLMNMNFRGKSKKMASYSIGVYLIHIFILRMYYLHTDFEGTARTFMVFISSILASYFLIKVNKRIKFIL